jgi:hypothetical protein
LLESLYYRLTQRERTNWHAGSSNLRAFVQPSENFSSVLNFLHIGPDFSANFIPKVLFFGGGGG